MKRRIWTIGLALLLLCSVWPSALFAAPYEPDFYLNVSKAEVRVGETIEVEIGLRNAQELVAFELNVKFDPSLWTAGSGAFTTSLTGFSSLVNTELLPGGQVRAVYSKLGDAAGESGSIVLGTVKLTAKAVGEGNFTLDAIKVGLSNDQWTTYKPATGANAVIVGNGTGGGSGDGTGGGSGSGSGTTPDNEPIITETSVMVGAPSIVGGTAQFKLNANHMQRAVDLLSGQTLRIEVQPGVAASKVEVEFPLAQVRGEAGQKAKNIVIDSGLAIVTLDRGLIDDESASNLQFSVRRLDVSSLPSNIGEQVNPGDAVYDFELLLDGRPISVFGRGEVTLEVPYTLRPGETADKIVIYYVTDSGELELVKNARYNPATGKVKFSPKHFSKYFPAYVHKTFGDLAQAAWARSYIEALAARDAVNGVGNDAYRPNGQLTRAQFITMLVQLFDLEDASATATFSDVQKGSWHDKAVASAQKLGIAQGKPDGSFGINDAISRQDMAVMLYRASKAMGLAWSPSAEAPAFADAASIAPYAVEAVAVMQEQGIINGMGENSFAPRGLSTRAQAAAVLYRMFGL
ncbi:S-layer homology domain-containing protein [Paenibacillus agaridevorans]|uniref:S-layer homology domain-containing protein n=1 Tax=Paenibacillus agaridevorans TaxID=171404 RepID=UPI001BE4119F|nr:S-layer homology domain-containing protein [Paenibacillus agaridevorans]